MCVLLCLLCSNTVVTCSCISANAISLLSLFPDPLSGNTIIRETCSHYEMAPVVQVGKCVGG